EHGIIVTCHSGGASIPGSQPITPEHLLHLRPDVCGHVNGGPTSLPADGVDRIIDETSMALQLVQAGNLRSAVRIMSRCYEQGRLERVVIGSDTPTGTGVMPLGMIKTVGSWRRSPASRPRWSGRPPPATTPASGSCREGSSRWGGPLTWWS